MIHALKSFLFLQIYREVWARKNRVQALFLNIILAGNNDDGIRAVHILDGGIRCDIRQPAHILPGMHNRLIAKLSQNSPGIGKLLLSSKEGSRPGLAQPVDHLHSVLLHQPGERGEIEPLLMRSVSGKAAAVTRLCEYIGDRADKKTARLQDLGELSCCPCGIEQVLQGLEADHGRNRSHGYIG